MLWTIIIGMTAGFIAGKIMRGKGFGLLVNLIVGVIGSYTGNFLYQQLGIQAIGLTAELVMSTIGAIIFLAILRIFK